MNHPLSCELVAKISTEYFGVDTANCRVVYAPHCATVIVGEEYVVKIYDKEVRTIERLRFEKEVLDSLKRSYDVPAFLEIRDGCYIAETAAAYIVKCKYVRGWQPYKNASAADGFLNDRHLAEAARFLATFNNDTRTIKVSAADKPGCYFPDYELLHNSNEEVYRNFSYIRDDETLELVNKIIRRSDKYRAQIGDIRFSDKGIIHNDYIPKNLVFSDAGTVSGLLDFDFCSHNNLIYDVLWTLDYIAYPRKELGNNSFVVPQNNVTRFLDEYLKTGTIEHLQQIPALLPLVKAGFNISVANYYAKTGNIRRATQELQWVVDFLEYYEKNPVKL